MQCITENNEKAGLTVKDRYQINEGFPNHSRCCKFRGYDTIFWHLAEKYTWYIVERLESFVILKLFLVFEVVFQLRVPIVLVPLLISVLVVCMYICLALESIWYIWHGDTRRSTRNTGVIIHQLSWQGIAGINPLADRFESLLSSSSRELFQHMFLPGFWYHRCVLTWVYGITPAG